MPFTSTSAREPACSRLDALESAGVPSGSGRIACPTSYLPTPYFRRISFTRAMGMASTVALREVTVVARRSELYTASSVASRAISKSGDTASVLRAWYEDGVAAARLIRAEAAVENAMA